MRKKHPDVRMFEPEGAAGYLVEQVRGIVADTALAPIQADRKVYILDRVDLLGVQAANAFLKTLEEPPADVVLILLARTRESVAAHHRLALPGGAVPHYPGFRGGGHRGAELGRKPRAGARGAASLRWLHHPRGGVS